MPSRRKHKTKPLIAKVTELAFAAPQVVAHRVTRMAIAGPSLSERDRRSSNAWVPRKRPHSASSWNAMVKQALRANQALTVSFLRSFWSPSFNAKPSASAVAAQLHSATLGVLGKGMAPVHRKAVANAKRLARTKLR